MKLGARWSVFCYDYSYNQLSIAIMTNPSLKSAKCSEDPLGDYVIRVGQLPEKIARIADNQRHMANSLGRAVIALRSMAALNNGRSYPESRNSAPNFGNDSPSC